MQQTWTVDGKMTFQISNSSVRAIHPRANTGLPQGVALTTPQNRSAVPTIAVHKNGQVSVLQKPGLTKVSSASDVSLQKLQTSTQSGSDQPAVSSPLPQQISVQVPLNWTGTGSNKSLLDSGKVSVLSSAQPGNQPVKTSQSLLEPVSSAVSSEPVSPGYQSMLTSTSMTSSSNIPAGISLAQFQKPVTTVNIAGVPKLTATKGGSFVLSSGNKVAFVPSSQVVTQIVKTDNKSVGKVTMAEAQIMLPSGPAKISWPVPPQTKDGKHILLTKPATQPGPSPVKGKSDTSIAVRPSIASSTSLIAGSKLVTDCGSHSKYLVQGNSATRTGPQKNMILKTQRSWELVKQASLLMPKKNVPFNNDSKSHTSERSAEGDTFCDKLEVKNSDQGDTGNESESGDDKEEVGKKEAFDSEGKTELSKTGFCKEHSDDLAKETISKVNNTDETSNSDDGEQIKKTTEDNNNEVHKNMEVDGETEGSDTRQKLDSNDENVSASEGKKAKVCVNVTKDGVALLDSSEEKTDFDSKTELGNIKKTESDVKLEPMDSDNSAEKEIKTPKEESKMIGGDDSNDFDAVGAMEWKDGIGELPGSDLKVDFLDL